METEKKRAIIFILLLIILVTVNTTYSVMCIDVALKDVVLILGVCFHYTVEVELRCLHTSPTVLCVQM